ncbi:hypothetical protein B0H17DRAFT_1185244 [Mycena rosella]|uniref:Uncharacterized protein n=1 Tax=Mycena rosella TaxID=1033263 RepID=A0AAD7G329_MYCRO|nr:hypothetical protein B0H17DRAFT_1185244 [Mycena rosella]
MSPRTKCACSHSEGPPHRWAGEVQNGEVRAALNISINLPLVKIACESAQFTAPARSLRDWMRSSTAKSLVKARRPCLVYDVTQSLICLMSTFEGAAREALTPMQRHFLVPVYPNIGPEKSPQPHVHSSPDWKSCPQQWILLVLIKPLGEDCQQLHSWGSEDKAWHFDEKAMSSLESIYKKKCLEWDKKCRSDHKARSIIGLQIDRNITLSPENGSGC